MLGISVRSNTREIVAEIDGLTRGEQRKAISRALNRAADGVVTDASSEIRKTYRIKKATVDAAFSRKSATPDSLSVLIAAKGRPLSLAGFSARQTKKGVTVNVKGVRKLVFSKGGNASFIQRLKTKKGDEYEVVFARVGKTRYPIQALKTVDVPGLFTKDDVQAVVNAKAFERFEVELRRQLAYILKLKNG